MRPTDAVDRVATVLEMLATRREGLRVAEVARELGVHKATASRLLGTLAARRLLERDASGRYRLGPGLIRYAAVAITGLDVVTRAREQLEELSSRTGETVSLAVLDGRDVVYVDQSAGDHAIVAANWVGRRSPAHASSSGKVLLAFADDDARERALAGPFERLTRHTIVDAEALRRALEEVRRLGYARTVGELEDGLTTVAAPVRARGETVAAVSVGGPSFRLPARELPRLGRIMIDAGAAIGHRIEGPVATG
jgi:IclR family acetate operon transcriptional repressor